MSRLIKVFLCCSFISVQAFSKGITDLEDASLQIIPRVSLHSQSEKIEDSGWNHLPFELQCLIFSFFPDQRCFSQMKGVSRHWFHAVKGYQKRQQEKNLEWLVGRYDSDKRFEGLFPLIHEREKALTKTFGFLEIVREKETSENTFFWNMHYIGWLPNVFQGDLSRISRHRFAEGRLDLGGLCLSSLPPSWDWINLSNRIQWLFLGNNQLTCLPHTLGALGCLHTLDVNHNLLSEIPASIKNLPGLYCLDLSHNQFETSPQKKSTFSIFPFFVHLRYLNLSNNFLREIPEEFSQMPVLQELNLSRNKIRHIISIPSVQELDLSYNEISRIPEEIGRFKKIRTLNLSHNVLEDISEEIERIDSVQFLDLSSNRLKKLPMVMGALKNLRTLNISNNLIDETPRVIFLLDPMFIKFNKLPKKTISTNPDGSFAFSPV